MAAAASGSSEEMESWLLIEPSAVETEKLCKNHFSAFKKQNFTSPIDFSYEFDSFGCSSNSLSSSDGFVVGSTEPGNSDQDDFLDGLTQRLIQQLTVKPEKLVMAGSPEESRTGGFGNWSVSSNGSPNEVLSPSTTPFEVKNDAWNLYYAAAGEVDRLKMGRESNKCRNFQEREPLGSFMIQNHETEPHNQTQIGFYLNPNLLAHCVSPKNQFHSAWGSRRQVKVGCYQAHRNDELQSPLCTCRHQHHHHHHQQRLLKNQNGVKCVRPWGFPRSELCSLQVQSNHHHHSDSGLRAVFPGGYSNVNKKKCAGTGVFFPRIYDDRKTANSPPKSEENSDLVMAGKRDNILGPQERNTGHDGVALKHPVRLPHEWSY